MPKKTFIVISVSAGVLLLASWAFSLVLLAEINGLKSGSGVMESRMEDISRAYEEGRDARAAAEKDAYAATARAEKLALDMEALKAGMAAMAEEIAALRQSPPATRKSAGADAVTIAETEPTALAASPDGAGETAEPVEAPEPIGTGALKAGDPLRLTVTAAELKNVYGYQFELRYDKSKFKYEGGLKSLLPDLSVIFARETDAYVLVGCTATGEGVGASGADKEICQISFTALADGVAPGDISLTGVNTVGADTKYTEGVGGWSFHS
ncbi:MAG: cohesin domain-containing protein [Clostridiales Family XIII bacterium]|jgi:hypothetical protein|nr:cohesin domain-containing protein [Clostridiales Family XIII bacterium]